MSQLEATASSYVPTKVRDIWEADNRLKSDYEAILVYCKQTGKPIEIILTHMAEFRAMQNLYEKILREIGSENLKQQTQSMAKNFEIEKRQYDENTPYLKVFLKGDADYDSVARHLATLHSIRRANVTDQQSGKRDLTIYPQKTYDISEVEQEVKLALTNYFEGSPADPIFATETISAISDRAYFQIIDYILRLGKNLESFKELNEKFDEERYRDYFIPSLNFVSTNHSAKGEVFNKKGKSDILVFDNDGNNIFIAECKLWKGEAYHLKSVDQLFENYVNWRDEKTSIIIFNRDNKKFSEVIEKATAAIESHPLCLKSLGKRAETSYSYLFKHPDDDQHTIKLELVLFHFA